MGNRCILTLENEQGTQHPIALYLHWNGGLESVLAFIQYTWDTYPRVHGDLFTFHARLCQVLGNFFPNGLSLYGHPLDEAAGVAEGCDNGRFHFTVGRTGFELKDRAEEVEKAKLHEYWTGSDGTIFDLIKRNMPKAEVVA